MNEHLQKRLTVQIAIAKAANQVLRRPGDTTDRNIIRNMARDFLLADEHGPYNGDTKWLDWADQDVTKELSALCQEGNSAWTKYGRDTNEEPMSDGDRMKLITLRPEDGTRSNRNRIITRVGDMTIPFAEWKWHEMTDNADSAASARNASEAALARLRKDGGRVK